MESTEDEEKAVVNFHQMELDDRILKAIAKLGWAKPTLIQERAVPLLLEGKDVLIKARTGSGKTGAFAIPVIQRILQLKESSAGIQQTSALVLAPSKELCHQLCQNFNQLTAKCSRDVKVIDISPKVDLSAQKPLLVDSPDVVVSTPARVVAHVTAGTLNLKCLKMLIVDEADLMFSFGYEDDVKEVIRYLPKVYQAALASATLSDDVLALKKILLHNAVTLKLNESQLMTPLSQLTHYKFFAERDDKCAVLCSLLKLGLIRGKILIFVNTVDKCYRLKLFLEQFKISSCVLNSELPAASRCHSVAQFNEDKYDIIIASDESCLDDPAKGSSKRNKDRESGIVRGIDFQRVSNIINFDFPTSVTSYVHRAGRTARGNNKGTVLSLVAVFEAPHLEMVDEQLKEALRLGGDSSAFRPFHFRMNEVDGFKYRAKDAWKSITKSAVREARLKEIKQEIFNSKKLKNFFEENPRDFNTLRHDKSLKVVKAPSHLANVPDYMVPPTLRNISSSLAKKKGKKYKPYDANQRYKVKMRNPLLNMDLPDL